MRDTSPIEVFNDLLDPLSRCLDLESSRRVTEFKITDAAQERIRILAERANEGLLTDDERCDCEAIINTADIISILKLKAQRNLTSKSD